MLLVVIGTDYIGSCKSNHQTITATTTPHPPTPPELEVELNAWSGYLD
jgi:hypothetical protein